MSKSAPDQKIIREDMSPELSDKRLAFILHNVLSPEECAGVIRAAEGVGFKRATVKTGFKTIEYQPHHREGENCYLVDQSISEMLLQRVKDHLPQEFRFGQLVGLNERMTVLRYGPGGFFGEHTDGTVITQDDSAISFITIQLYLNDAFEGGETAFYPDGLARRGQSSATGDEPGAECRPRVVVSPRTGSAAIFEHKILHEGCLVKSGMKLTLRADVMYTRYYPPLSETDGATAPAAAIGEEDGESSPALPWNQPSVWSKCTVQ